jgi:hypothetical protein
VQRTETIRPTPWLVSQFILFILYKDGARPSATGASAPPRSCAATCTPRPMQLPAKEYVLKFKATYVKKI